jgi:hypothetical protein
MNFNKIFICCLKKYKIKYQKENSISEEVNKIIAEKSELIKLNDSIFKIHKYNIKNTSPFRTNESINNFSKNSLEAMKTEGGKLKRKSSELSLLQNNKIFGLKDKLRCFFCGGVNCKHENYLNNIENNNAITGLNSNYITDDVIASQRPSEVLINKYNLIKTFKEKNIGLIINLQREGEHPFCGPNAYHLTSSGFSYNPSVFTGNDILCRLYGWKDMSTPTTLGFMIEIVKEMTVMVREEKKKVLVHCHAGYGRTGVVIACYMIYNNINKDVDDIIKSVKKQRKKCIETKMQKKFCDKFHAYISHIRKLFDENNHKEKIETFLRFQEEMLCGEEQLNYGIVPMLLIKCLEKFVVVGRKFNLKNVQIYKIIKDYSPFKISSEINEILITLKESINNGNWTLFDKLENLKIVIALLFQWLSTYVLYTINPQRTEKILLNEIYKKIEEVVKIKKGGVNEISKLIKTGFYCYEYETMYTLAIFLNNYQPENNVESTFYKEMLDAFSLRLLGYEMNDIYIDQSKNFKQIKNRVTGLSTILEFIIYTIPFYSEENDSLFSNNIQKFNSLKNLTTDSRKNFFHLHRINKLNNYIGTNSHLIDSNLVVASVNSMKSSSSISKSIDSKNQKSLEVENKSENNIEKENSEKSQVNNKNNHLIKYENENENEEKLIHLHTINNND